MKKIYNWLVVNNAKLNDYKRFWLITTIVWIVVFIFDLVAGEITTKTFTIYVMLIALFAHKTYEEMKK
ncbi:MAG: hypothetical protein EOL93_01845 [Epsilonproteobacteria bacterium]|nr:hypothetical protein [Campylobacterota bacterium]